MTDKPHQRVLVVDDDEDIRFLLRTTFRREGFHVAEARNGQEAVARAQEQHFDAVVMDIAMPVMDGHEACRILRSDPDNESTAIIMITGRAASDATSEMVACADEWLRKPFDIAELPKIVRSVVSKRRGE